MNEIREMINISYFDNKNTTLKEHCDIYSNVKKEVLEILNKYDIKYVVAETEAVRDLVKENQQLKEQLEKNEKARKEAIEFINDPWILSDYKIGNMLHDYKTRVIEILDIDERE